VTGAWSASCLNSQQRENGEMLLEFWCHSVELMCCGLGQTALRLGRSRPLPELFQAAGCKFEFSAKTIQPVAKMLREELEKL